MARTEEWKNLKPTGIVVIIGKKEAKKEIAIRADMDKPF